MKILISEDQYEKIKKEVEKSKKDDSARFIKCDGCKKRFTQTIHKGKKSTPICPWCGKNNSQVDENQDVDERSRKLAFTRKKRLFSKAEIMANPARYSKHERALKNLDEIGVYDFADIKDKEQLDDYQQLMDEHPLLKEANGFVFLYNIFEEDGSPSITIYVLDPKEKVHVGSAVFEMRSGDDFYVTLPYVIKEYRNRGIGTEIYKCILMFGNLVSGSVQSKQAVALWKKLYKELPNEMTYFDAYGREHQIDYINGNLIINDTKENIHNEPGGHLKIYKDSIKK